MDDKNEKYKEATRNNWNADPCGTRDVDKSRFEYLSAEYFDELEKARYTNEKWILEEMDLMELNGKKVLEIGYGMGSDHVQLGKRGALLHGIDLTEGNLPITQKHLAYRNLQSELRTGDAENLPYEDNSFDFVWSVGVLHHTPDMEKAIDEVYRVLKPGGGCFIALYNKNSWFYRCMVVPLYYWNKEYKEITMAERLSMVEYPGTNKDILVRLTTKRELRKIFSKYKIQWIRTRGLTRDSFIFRGRLLSDGMIDRMGKRAGWYNIIYAKKGN